MEDKTIFWWVFSKQCSNLFQFHCSSYFPNNSQLLCLPRYDYSFDKNNDLMTIFFHTQSKIDGRTNILCGCSLNSSLSLSYTAHIVLCLTFSKVPLNFSHKRHHEQGTNNYYKTFSYSSYTLFLSCPLVYLALLHTFHLGIVLRMDFSEFYKSF